MKTYTVWYEVTGCKDIMAKSLAEAEAFVELMDADKLVKYDDDIRITSSEQTYPEEDD